MTTSALALRYQNGGCAVHRYANGTTTQLGNSFSSADGYNSERHPQSMVINVSGDLFALGMDGIYRKKDPLTNAGDWEQMIAYTTPQVDRITGLYLADDAGTPTLVCLVGSTASDGAHYLYKMPLTKNNWDRVSLNHL